MDKIKDTENGLCIQPTSELNQFMTDLYDMHGYAPAHVVGIKIAERQDPKVKGNRVVKTRGVSYSLRESYNAAILKRGEKHVQRLNKIIDRVGGVLSSSQGSVDSSTGAHKKPTGDEFD